MVGGDAWKEGQDVVVEMSYDTLPPIPEVDAGKIKLDRLIVKADDKAVDEALENLAGQAKSFDDRKKGAKAKDGDQVVIDFKGSVDGELFEGGSGEDYPLVLGSNSFIPGFEAQLVGAKVGDEVSVNVTFPEDYGAAHLAGKAAVFACTVKAVKEPKAAEIDDELAKKFGADDLAALKAQIAERLEAEYKGAARAVMKRSLLDQLDGDGQVRPAGEPGRGGSRPDRPPALPRRASGRSRPQPRRDRDRRTSTRHWPCAACVLAFCWPRSAARPKSP